MLHKIEQMAGDATLDREKNKRMLEQITYISLFYFFGRTNSYIYYSFIVFLIGKNIISFSFNSLHVLLVGFPNNSLSLATFKADQ